MTRKSLLVTAAAIAAVSVPTVRMTASTTPTYDITTLAGKVASLQGTAGLQIRFSAFVEEEAAIENTPQVAGAPLTWNHILSSPLDGSSIAGPAVIANQDRAGAPQNETAIAVDPNRPNRLVAGANDYVSRTWSCTIDGTPCSSLGDGYSGTYYSDNGGATWCCSATDPQHLGTIIPGVTRLAGGQYDAGGDPAVAFDGEGTVYYAGLGFNRASAPNTVTVSKGTFGGDGALTWAAPVFINQTTSPSIFNDKEWIAADSHVGSRFRDRVYVSWTRFVFNPVNGAYVQSPIAFSYSSDGGKTFSQPALISGNVLYGQGSRPVVGPDGTVYVVWDGSTRLQSLDSIWMVKSTDGGATWSKPRAIAPVADVIELANTAFRVNSFPAADVAPNGDLYVAWSSEVRNDQPGYVSDTSCASWIVGRRAVRANCHSQAAYSRSTDGGATWSTASPIFPNTETSTSVQVAEGYPPPNSTFGAPATLPRVESLWPAVAASSNGRVYMSAYVATTVSPWQTCAQPAPGVAGRISCDTLGPYIHNSRLEYLVTNLGTGTVQAASTHPINTRYGFGGGFIGDYTALAAGSDDVYHACWTDTNDVQDVSWFYGVQFSPVAPIHQQDVVVRSGTVQ